MPRSYSRTRAWGCAANAGGWLPVPTAVMSWCPVNGTGSSRRRKLPKEEKHEEEMRFCREFNDLRCEMLIDMAKKIEEYLLQDI